MIPWADEQIDFLRSRYAELGASEAARALGRNVGSVRNKAYRLGITQPQIWSKADVALLRDAYTAAGGGKIDLAVLAKAVGRGKPEVCRKARQLGLSNNRRLKSETGPRDRRKFGGDAAAVKAHLAQCRKDHFAANGHPRGMAGKKHSADALARMSEASKANWASMTDERLAVSVRKMIETKFKNGTGPAQIARGTWKAGWREIGGKRNFYRSRWEANYGRYLEWLKSRGVIAEWQHEPEVFWFETIKRGTRSYKPDFRVWENDGTSALHEVKGWMDSRSRTCLARMAKYHPNQKIILIDGPQYRAIRAKVMGLIEGWEDAARDSHA